MLRTDKLKRLSDAELIKKLQLAISYETGKGKERNIKNAIELYAVMANQGYAPAQYCLGLLYDAGNGLEKDINKAVELYTLAANQDYPPAQVTLGFLHEDGDGVEQDINKSIELYALAANKEYEVAQYNLGLLYIKGSGVEQDFNKAAKLYALAAEKGYAAAQNNLAALYETGEGVKQDVSKSVRLYTLAANQGYAVAQANLAFLYIKGIGVDQDINKSVTLYALAANQGHVEAKENLSYFYKTDKGFSAIWDSMISNQKRMSFEEQVCPIFTQVTNGIPQGVLIYQKMLLQFSRPRMLFDAEEVNEHQLKEDINFFEKSCGEANINYALMIINFQKELLSRSDDAIEKKNVWGDLFSVLLSHGLNIASYQSLPGAMSNKTYARNIVREIDGIKRLDAGNFYGRSQKRHPYTLIIDRLVNLILKYEAISKQDLEAKVPRKYFKLKTFSKEVKDCHEGNELSFQCTIRELLSCVSDDNFLSVIQAFVNKELDDLELSYKSLLPYQSTEEEVVLFLSSNKKLKGDTLDELNKVSTESDGCYVTSVLSTSHQIKQCINSEHKDESNPYLYVLDDSQQDSEYCCLMVHIKNPGFSDEVFKTGYVSFILSYFIGLVNFYDYKTYGKSYTHLLRRQSFGELMPSVTDTDAAFRVSMGLQPISFSESVNFALAQLKIEINKLVQQDKFQADMKLTRILWQMEKFKLGKLKSIHGRNQKDRYKKSFKHQRKYILNKYETNYTLSDVFQCEAFQVIAPERALICHISAKGLFQFYLNTISCKFEDFKTPLPKDMPLVLTGELIAKERKLSFESLKSHFKREGKACKFKRPSLKLVVMYKSLVSIVENSLEKTRLLVMAQEENHNPLMRFLMTQMKYSIDNFDYETNSDNALTYEFNKLFQLYTTYKVTKMTIRETFKKQVQLGVEIEGMTVVMKEKAMIESRGDECLTITSMNASKDETSILSESHQISFFCGHETHLSSKADEMTVFSSDEQTYGYQSYYFCGGMQSLSSIVNSFKESLMLANDIGFRVNKTAYFEVHRLKICDNDGPFTIAIDDIAPCITHLSSDEKAQKEGNAKQGRIFLLDVTSASENRIKNHIKETHRQIQQGPLLIITFGSDVKIKKNGVGTSASGTVRLYAFNVSDEVEESINVMFLETLYDQLMKRMEEVKHPHVETENAIAKRIKKGMMLNRSNDGESQMDKLWVKSKLLYRVPPLKRQISSGSTMFQKKEAPNESGCPKLTRSHSAL